MPRIRYLSVLSPDPVGLAGFYTRHLGMREMGRSANGDISLTDGGMNFTLFKQRPRLHEPRQEQGYHHLGIAVENIDEVIERYHRFHPRGVVVKESADLQHGEVRIHDPECNPVTLSHRNFGVSGPEPGTPRIAHIALNAVDTYVIFDFYTQVFGFRELVRAHAARMVDPNYRNKHVGDGFTNVAIQGFYNEEEGFEPRFGIAHMGFLVNNSDILAQTIKGEATITERPATRKQSEIRMRDPQGNGCDLSQRGWEVDTDKWARADAV